VPRARRTRDVPNQETDITVRARKISFDNLTPILWHKITNANYETGSGSGFLVFGAPRRVFGRWSGPSEAVIGLRAVVA